MIIVWEKSNLIFRWNNS